MRLLATIVLSIVLLGGTWLFVDIDSKIKRKPPEATFATASAETTIQIVRNFDCEGNADFGDDAIKASFVGKAVYKNEAAIVAADEPISFVLQGVEVGKNSITVFANAAISDDFGDSGPKLKSMLVKVLYDNRELTREVFASDDDFNMTVGGEVSFFIEGSREVHDHAH